MRQDPFLDELTRLSRPLIRPFGNKFVLFGLPPNMPVPGGCVRGEDLADLRAQVNAVGDDAALRELGIKP